MEKRTAAALRLLIILCILSSSFSLPGDQAANKPLLIKRQSDARDILNSAQEGASEVIYLNLFQNGTEIINSATQYFVGSLGVYYSIPRAVIDTIRPGPLPYGKILLINYVKSIPILGCFFSRVFSSNSKWYLGWLFEWRWNSRITNSQEASWWIGHTAKHTKQHPDDCKQCKPHHLHGGVKKSCYHCIG